jgi:hypothetical protein
VQRILRILVEIRLRRSDEVRNASTDDRLGLWVPDTPPARAKLARAVEFANKLHGSDTHWIEERQA